MRNKCHTVAAAKLSELSQVFSHLFHGDRADHNVSNNTRYVVHGNSVNDYVRVKRDKNEVRMEKGATVVAPLFCSCLLGLFSSDLGGSLLSLGCFLLRLGFGFFSLGFFSGLSSSLSFGGQLLSDGFGFLA